MNAISSASPAHVLVGSARYDVVCWTLDPEMCHPIAWIIRDGELVSEDSLPIHLGSVFREGTVAAADQRDGE
jgi:hypothetical protein